MPGNFLYIHDIISPTEVEGPGKRMAVWVQGCSIRCKGCFSPHTWEQQCGKHVPVSHIVEHVVRDDTVEGITILGGEPLDQPQGVLELVSGVHNSGKTVMLFTGYYMCQLPEGISHDILSCCDIVIDGPYVESKQEFIRPWVGSSNQGIHFLTPCYREVENRLNEYINTIEVRLMPDGSVKVNGMLEREALNNMLTKI